MQMRNKLTFTPQQSSVYDYSASVAKAVEWLGARYLLSKSIKRSINTGRSSLSTQPPPAHPTCNRPPGAGMSTQMLNGQHND